METDSKNMYILFVMNKNAGIGCTDEAKNVDYKTRLCSVAPSAGKIQS